MFHNFLKLFSRRGEAPNFSKAKELYNLIIKRGNSNRLSAALYEMATILEEEEDPDLFSDISFEMMLRSADLGYPDAQRRIAAAYMTGFYGGIIPVDPGR